MTGYAFGFALPEFAKVIVKSLASTIFFHPTASMVGTVAVTVAANSENVVECIKKHYMTQDLQFMKVLYVQ